MAPTLHNNSHVHEGIHNPQMVNSKIWLLSYSHWGHYLTRDSVTTLFKYIKLLQQLVWSYEELMLLDYNFKISNKYT